MNEIDNIRSLLLYMANELNDADVHPDAELVSLIEIVESIRDRVTPTPALPLGIDRCVIQYDSNTRCRNRRLGEQRTCGVDNKCNFGPTPESKPTPKPPYIPNTSEMPEETLARINAPASTTCPASEPMTAQDERKLWDKFWKRYSLMFISQRDFFHYAKQLTEEFHGIKP